MSDTKKPGRGWLRLLVLVVVLVLMVGGGFWAGRVTLRAPAPVVVDDPSGLLVSVVDQTVGKSFQYNVSVSRDRTPVAVNVLAGVVTGVSPSGLFDVGGVLYWVDGVPVRVVEGLTPFYRDLASGARGADVGELRDALHTMGFLAASGGLTFDAATVKAVKAWQKQLGVTQSGVVRFGELVAVGRLPAVLTLDVSLWVGGVLSGGERVVFDNAGVPTFVLELGATEAQQITADATVEVMSGGYSWPAVITGQSQTPSGTVQFSLAAPDGGVVCGDDCDVLPADQETIYLLSRVSVVPPVSGPGVPVAAITTKVDGSTVVFVDDNGIRVETPVTVLGSQDGVAVVDGVTDGQRVYVFGDAGSGTGVTVPSASRSGP